MFKCVYKADMTEQQINMQKKPTDRQIVSGKGQTIIVANIVGSLLNQDDNICLFLKKVI